MKRAEYAFGIIFPLFCIVVLVFTYPGCDSKPAASATTPTMIRLPDGREVPLFPGDGFEAEFEEEIGSAFHKREGEASGVGAGLKGAGDEVAAKHNASSPKIWSPDGWGAEGGDTDIEAAAIGRDPQEAVRSWMFWAGVVLLLGAAGLWKFGKTQSAVYAAAAGTGCIAIAFYPGLIVLILLVVAVVAFWPLIRAEIQRGKAEVAAEKNKELNRSFVWARNLLPPDLRDEFDKALAGQLEPADVKALEDLYVNERIGVPKIVPAST